MDENQVEKRPGKPRVHFTKSVKFRVDGAMLVPLGRGKPAKGVTVVSREMPFNWQRQNIPA